MAKTKKTSKAVKAPKISKVSIGKLALAIHNSYLCQHVLEGKEKSDFISRILALPEKASAAVYKIFQDEAKEQGKLDAAMEKETAKLNEEYLKKLKTVVKDVKKKAEKSKEIADRKSEEKAADVLLDQLENI